MPSENISEFEKFLQKNAIYSTEDKLKPTIIADEVDIANLKYISRGLNTRVFKIANKPWIIKEGRWDLDISLFENTNIKLPADLLENFLGLFEYYFLPREAEIKRQYELYLEFVKYFGCFSGDNDYYHPEYNILADTQEKIRSNLIEFKANLEKLYNIKFNKKLDAILKSEYAKTNFVPKEYLLYGKSFSPENEGKNTYFIFQEYVEGEVFNAKKLKTLTEDQKGQLIVLAFLVLLMKAAKDFVPDLRPQHLVGGANNWFSNTDNIIIGDNGVKFIDTRWMWNIKDNLVKRGMLIPELIEESAKQFILEMLDNV